MFRVAGVVLALCLSGSAQRSSAGLTLHRARTSAGDLEIGGDIAGLPARSTRYLRYEDLLKFPQETYTVKDDSNFRGTTVLDGIALATLAKQLGQRSDLIVAICYDKYRTNYPPDYLAAHRPMLVLRINGQERDHWPAAADGSSFAPFLISHPEFKPAFTVLAHRDEPQIPYGVTRLEFRHMAQVFGAITPAATTRDNLAVKQGFTIARQDCFKCHNAGAEGGTMSGRSWMILAADARKNEVRFRRIIRDPASVIPSAKGPAHADYDDATLDALTRYFRTFAAEAP